MASDSGNNVDELVTRALPGLSDKKHKALVKLLKRLGVHDQQLQMSVFINGDSLLKVLTDVEKKQFMKFLKHTFPAEYAEADEDDPERLRQKLERAEMKLKIDSKKLKVATKRAELAEQELREQRCDLEELSSMAEESNRCVRQILGKVDFLDAI